MRRTEHLGARVLTAVGLAASFVYLVWRAGFSLHDTDLWLSLPTLLVEVVGFVGAGALAWALWPMPNRPTVGAGSPAGDAVATVDAVVRVADQAEYEVRATLLALRGVHHVKHLVVVDLSARPSIALLATEFQAVYAATDPGDRNGLRVMAAAVESPQFLLVDAGDVPTGDIVDRLAADLGDARVAVAQGMGVSLADDSAEHGPDGRHELVFERSSLNPALGRRGCAAWLGTGSLVRTDALREVTIGNDPALEAHWLAGAELLAAGWRITAPGEVAVLAHRPVHSEHAVAQDRLQRARAARRMVFGGRGVLRSESYSRGQRLSVLAWSVRPLSGLRRVVFLALLGSALLEGSVPFHARAIVLVCGWLPAFVYTSLGLALLSGWTLQPGDRTRWSLHSIGSACRSLSAGSSDRPATRAPIVSLPSPQYGAGLFVAVVGLSVILALRGISDRVTHTLGTLPQSSLMALLIVTLWTLAMSLDLLRVLARRNQLRRAARVVSSLSATLGERAVSIVDLTAVGAGLISQTGVELNERLLLDSAVPTRTGVTTMRVSCVVRNVSVRADGDFRIGVEFGETDDATANALAEFCTIEPIWDRLGALPGGATVKAQLMYVDEPENEPSSGRMAVRLVSLLALVGAVASSAPTTVDASNTLDHRLSGVVVAVGEPPLGTDTGPADTVIDTTVIDTTVIDTTVIDTTVADTAVATTLESNLPTLVTEAPTVVTDVPAGVPGAVVVGVCSLDAGLDGVWGTSDDTYTAPVATVTAPDGTYHLDLVGTACWATIAPPTDYEDTVATNPDDALLPQPVDVSGTATTGRTVVLRRVHATDANEPALGAIGDTVWNDTDSDGVQDVGEPGVAGVLLTLFDDRGHNVASATSDAAGEFGFGQLPAGTYRVGAANLPDGFMFTHTGQGRDALSDSDADPVTGRTDAVSLKAGETAPGVDIGLRARPVGEPAEVAAAQTAAVAEKVLPAPGIQQLAVPGSPRSTLSIFVLVLAGFLALSILLGLVRPRSGRAA
jgi:hypothetical protein